MNALFAGLVAFPITPTTASGEVLEPDLQRLARRIETGGADAVGLLGSTGAYMFLGCEQRPCCGDRRRRGLDPGHRRGRSLAHRRRLRPDLTAFRKAAPGLSIGYSGDWGCMEALLAGADCWYSVVGGLLPAQAAALAAAARSGDRAEARRLDAGLEPLWSLFRDAGSLRLMYAAANILGLTSAQPPAPLLPVNEVLRDRLGSLLAAGTGSL